MSRVVDCSSYLSNRTVERLIISGSYESDLVRKLGTRRAERALLNLVNFTSENSRSKPEWWPSNGTFLATVEALRKETQEASEKWSQMLRSMLIHCNAYYKKRPLVSRKRLRTVSEVRSRTVSEVHDKTASDVHTRTTCDAHYKTASDVHTKIASEEHTKKAPVVRTRSAAKRRRLQPLNDISNLTFEQAVQTDNPLSTNGKCLQPFAAADKQNAISISRLQFMTFLDLKPVTSMFTQTKRTESDDPFRYTPNIPFSSDIGRKLVNKERYTLTKELYARKTERLDYYMQETSTPDFNKEYEVTYSKKHKSDHMYNFPRRQHRQAKRYIHLLRDVFCKPVSVTLERLDVEDHLRKVNGCRDVCVILTRLN